MSRDEEVTNTFVFGSVMTLESSLPAFAQQCSPEQAKHIRGRLMDLCHTMDAAWPAFTTPTGEGQEKK